MDTIEVQHLQALECGDAAGKLNHATSRKVALPIQVQDKYVGVGLQLAHQLRELGREEVPEAYSLSLSLHNFTFVCAIQPAAAVLAEV